MFVLSAKTKKVFLCSQIFTNFFVNLKTIGNWYDKFFISDFHTWPFDSHQNMISPMLILLSFFAKLA